MNPEWNSLGQLKLKSPPEVPPLCFQVSLPFPSIIRILIRTEYSAHILYISPAPLSCSSFWILRSMPMFALSPTTHVQASTTLMASCIPIGSRPQCPPSGSRGGHLSRSASHLERRAHSRHFKSHFKVHARPLSSPSSDSALRTGRPVRPSKSAEVALKDALESFA